MIWLVRRELWENRSIFIAPLCVAIVVVIGSAFNFAYVQQPDKLALPYNLAALMIMGATFIVGIFYCLDALYGERRDRSILFWKSLPVSDLHTVLAKAAIPIIILPLVSFVMTVITQFIMLLLNTMVLLAQGHSAAALWKLPWISMTGMLLYHLVAVHGLYYAPLFAWLLFVSAWARHATVLWAFVPLAAIGVLERVAFNTMYFAHILGARISGGMRDSDAANSGVNMLGHFHPLHYLSDPGLWLGFVVAALFLAGAVRLRRQRAPI